MNIDISDDRYPFPTHPIPFDMMILIMVATITCYASKKMIT